MALSKVCHSVDGAERGRKQHVTCEQPGKCPRNRPHLAQDLGVFGHSHGHQLWRQLRHEGWGNAGLSASQKVDTGVRQSRSHEEIA